jgi:redox-sensitive bicupin YhaK (pirin superfamily)
MNNQNPHKIPVAFLDSSAEPVPFFHVWLYPSRREIGSRAAADPQAEASSHTLTLGCSPAGGEKTVKFHQDVELFLGKPGSDPSRRQPGNESHGARIQVLAGDLDINGEKLCSGDVASLDEEKELHLSSERGAHFLLIDLC